MNGLRLRSTAAPAPLPRTRIPGIGALVIRAAAAPRPAPRPERAAAGVLENVRTGRFQRLLSAASGLGAAVTAAEIFFEHDRASFGNRMMWLPVVLGPVGLAAGAAGAVSARAARTVLPVTSAVIVANGLQGTYLHARGVGQRPGGWDLARYNIENGPPVLAPLLVTMVGGMGLVAAVLRRERG